MRGTSKLLEEELASLKQRLRQTEVRPVCTGSRSAWGCVHGVVSLHGMGAWAFAVAVVVPMPWVLHFQ